MLIIIILAFQMTAVKASILSLNIQVFEEGERDTCVEVPLVLKLVLPKFYFPSAFIEVSAFLTLVATYQIAPFLTFRSLNIIVTILVYFSSFSSLWRGHLWAFFPISSNKQGVFLRLAFACHFLYWSLFYGLVKKNLRSFIASHFSRWCFAHDRDVPKSSHYRERKPGLELPLKVEPLRSTIPRTLTLQLLL